MKKYFLFIACLSVLSFSYAQESILDWDIPENMITTPGETKTISPDLNSESITDIQNIKARFCNDDELTQFLDLEMRPWERKEICVILGNDSDTPANVLLWFSEWVINEDNAPICDGDDSNKNNFAKQIVPRITTGVIVPAYGNIIQKFWYTAPKSASGNVFGCFGFKNNKEEKIESGKMFLIVPRKVGYIYINITWDVYNFGRRDNIKYTCTTNKQTILKKIIGI